MSTYNTPLVIKRALVHQIQILPFEFDGIVNRYEMYKMPDEVLGKLSKHDLSRYIRALFLSSCEMAGDWYRGHEILLDLGFKKIERRDGHRVYVRMAWPKPEAKHRSNNDEND